MKRTAQTEDSKRRPVPRVGHLALAASPLWLAGAVYAAQSGDAVVLASGHDGAGGLMLAGASLIVLAALSRRFKRNSIKEQTPLS